MIHHHLCPLPRIHPAHFKLTVVSPFYRPKPVTRPRKRKPFAHCDSQLDEAPLKLDKGQDRLKAKLLKSRCNNSKS